MNKFPILLIFILVILFSSLVLGILFVWPKYSEFRSLLRSVSQKNQEVKTTEQYFSDLQKTKAELDNYKPEMAKINSALPDNPEIPDLLNYLQQISSQSGLVLKNIGAFNSAYAKDQPTIKETQLTFSVEGPYSSLKNFISALETSARLIEVDSLDFSSPEKGQIFSFNFNVKIRSH